MEIHQQELVCDFCNAANPGWVYVTEDFTQEFEDDKQHFSLGLVGSWAACDTCRKLIDGNKRHRLATRVVNEYAEELDPVTRRTVYKRLRQAYDEFYIRRSGEAIPMDEYMRTTNETPGVTRFWEDPGD